MQGLKSPTSARADSIKNPLVNPMFCFSREDSRRVTPMTSNLKILDPSRSIIEVFTRATRMLMVHALASFLEYLTVLTSLLPYLPPLLLTSLPNGNFQMEFGCMSGDA